MEAKTSIQVIKILEKLYRSLISTVKVPGWISLCNLHLAAISTLIQAKHSYISQKLLHQTLR